jgi:hypothetical protein
MRPILHPDIAFAPLGYESSFVERRGKRLTPLCTGLSSKCCKEFMPKIVERWLLVRYVGEDH